MKLFYRLLVIKLVFLAAFCSCGQEGDLGYIDYQPFVAVEGRIESGRGAFVLLTWTSSFNETVDTTYLLQHVIKSAKVIVHSQTQSEILTLGTQSGTIPPYAYYGTKIIGEPGEKYRLEIQYQGRVLTAETYIPEPIPLRDIWFERTSPQSLTGHIHIAFDDDPSQQRYYQVSTMVSGKEKVYTPCLYGNMDNKQFGGQKEISMPVNKGPILFPKTSFVTYFAIGDEISIQFKTMPRAGYDFWNSWQNELLNAQNPIFPAQTNLQSNIEGGVGIWCGYGVREYRLNALKIQRE